jgi:hypothetical protein
MGRVRHLLATLATVTYLTDSPTAVNDENRQPSLPYSFEYQLLPRRASASGGNAQRTPSPTCPSAHVNSIPFASSTIRIARQWLGFCRLKCPFSKARSVDRPTPAASASSAWVESSNARAARHWAGVIQGSDAMGQPFTSTSTVYVHCVRIHLDRIATYMQVLLYEQATDSLKRGRA